MCGHPAGASKPNAPAYELYSPECVEGWGFRKFEKFGYESPLGEIRRWVKTEYPVRP